MLSSINAVLQLKLRMTLCG